MYSTYVCTVCSCMYVISWCLIVALTLTSYVGLGSGVSLHTYKYICSTLN